MVNVTKSNFIEQSNDFIRNLPNASFISIDEEMSGISVPVSGRVNGYNRPSRVDPPYQQYELRLKQSAERYSIIQLGISLFEAIPKQEQIYDKDDGLKQKHAHILEQHHSTKSEPAESTENRGYKISAGTSPKTPGEDKSVTLSIDQTSNTTSKEWIVRKYNFYMFPDDSSSSVREVVLSPGAIAFLRSHNMSLDTWCSKGIPYVCAGNATSADDENKNDPTTADPATTAREAMRLIQEYRLQAFKTREDYMNQGTGSGTGDESVSRFTPNQQQSGEGTERRRVQLTRTEDIAFFANTMASIREWLDNPVFAPSTISREAPMQPASELVEWRQRQQQQRQPLVVTAGNNSSNNGTTGIVGNLLQQQHQRILQQAIESQSNNNHEQQYFVAAGLNLGHRQNHASRTTATSILLPPCNSYLRRALYEGIQLEYPALITECVSVGTNHHQQQIRVLRLSDEERHDRYIKGQREKWEIFTLTKIGMWRIYAALTLTARGHTIPVHTPLFASSFDNIDWDNCLKNDTLHDDLFSVLVQLNHPPLSSQLISASTLPTQFATTSSTKTLDNHRINRSGKKHIYDNPMIPDPEVREVPNPTEPIVARKKEDDDTIRQGNSEQYIFATCTEKQQEHRYKAQPVPIVVHNGFMDLLFLMTHFYCNKLPGNLVDCKRVLSKHFPVIYDTKVIATEYWPSASLYLGDDTNNSGATALSNLYNRIVVREQQVYRPPAVVASPSQTITTPTTAAAGRCYSLATQSSANSAVIATQPNVTSRGYPSYQNNTMAQSPCYIIGSSFSVRVLDQLQIVRNATLNSLSSETGEAASGISAGNITDNIGRIGSATNFPVTSSSGNDSEGNEDQEHEAAYDAYMTGAVFIALSQLVWHDIAPIKHQFELQMLQDLQTCDTSSMNIDSEKPVTSKVHDEASAFFAVINDKHSFMDFLLASMNFFPAMTKKYDTIAVTPRKIFGQNRLFQMSMYTLDLELESPSDPLSRGLLAEATYRVAGIDKSTTTNDIVRCLSGLVDTNGRRINFEIVWVDDTTFLAGPSIRGWNNNNNNRSLLPSASNPSKSLVMFDNSGIISNSKRYEEDIELLLNEHGSIMYNALANRFHYCKDSICSLSAYLDQHYAAAMTTSNSQKSTIKPSHSTNRKNIVASLLNHALSYIGLSTDCTEKHDRESSRKRRRL